MLSVFNSILAFALSLQSADAEASTPPPAAVVQGPVVVELFTSQGCPMCPGANALLAELGEENADVLTLAYGVDYWDVYGWEDTFAMAAFTARQQAYVDAGEAHRVYTPHFIVNGAPEKLRYSEERVRAAVNEAAPLPVLMTAQAGRDAITVRLDGPARPSPARLWRVTYRPGVETRLIEDGPNAGREMVHYNMARDIESLGAWSGGRLEVRADPAPDGLAAVILVQDGPGGRILSAARIDRP